MKTNRLEFDRKTKEERWEHANGFCEYCHQPFGQRRPEYHHHLPAAIGGKNDFDNCRCICPPCHRLVTKEEDMPRITKAKAVERGRMNVSPKRPWPRKRDVLARMESKT